jgi:hypothetical protein
LPKTLTLRGFSIRETPDELVYLGSAGPLAVLRKPYVTPNKAHVREGGPGFYDQILTAPCDVLGEGVLAAGEPSAAALEGVLPSLIDYAFMGDDRTLDRWLLRPDGSLFISEEEVMPGPGAHPENPPASCLLDGTLPVICQRWETREQMTFATSGPEGQTHVWLRITERGKTAYSCHESGKVSPQEFHDALLQVVQENRAWQAEGINLALPEADLLDTCRGMLRLGCLTFSGVLPRYGAGPYHTTRSHGFPPNIIFLGEALLAWGYLTEARDLVGHYLSRYVKPDGTFDYYGPAVAEYGEVLSLAVAVARLTGDDEWLQQRLGLIRPIWQRLLALRQAGLTKYPPTDPHHGLIPGLPEADYHDQEGQWEQFYYSGDVWTIRALRQVGGWLAEQGNAALQSEGRVLLTEAAAYDADLQRSLARIQPTDSAYVPPGPDQLEAPRSMTESFHTSYCNYRYLPEMISAGVLSPDAMTRVLNYRREHGGELLAMTRWGELLDDWPALHQARAMLETDDIEHYLLLLYAHWAYHCGHGHLTAYEHLYIRPDEHGWRRSKAGQVVPCQTQVPIMVRWALVYEERDAEVLWLCRATPRRWLQPGGRVQIDQVPTRFGTVGFTLTRSSASAGRLVLNLPKEGLSARLKIRLRLPLGERVTVTCDGQPVRVTRETVTLPAGLSGKVTLQLRFGTK